MREVDLTGFLPLFENLEEFINRQGFTLGKEAEKFDKLLNAVLLLYWYDSITDEQNCLIIKRIKEQMNEVIKEKGVL